MLHLSYFDESHCFVSNFEVEIRRSYYIQRRTFVYLTASSVSVGSNVCFYLHAGVSQYRQTGRGRSPYALQWQLYVYLPCRFVRGCACLCACVTVHLASVPRK